MTLIALVMEYLVDFSFVCIGGLNKFESRLYDLFRGDILNKIFFIFRVRIKFF